MRQIFLNQLLPIYSGTDEPPAKIPFHSDACNDEDEM